MLALLAVAASCGDDVLVGVDRTGGADGGGGTGALVAVKCQNHIYQCGDLLDNDGDGLIDADDPDCLGPCDNTEASYYGGIPGQNNAPCRQDCYFDQDTGTGNDDCYWNHQCDPLSVGPGFPPSGDAKCAHDPLAKTSGTSASCAELSLTQSPACLAYCGPLTPNGCDCFGCCELPAGSGKHVWLGSTAGGLGTCDRERLSDPTACRPCTPVPSCTNGCDECELCVGKAALPQTCAGPDAAVQQCPDGAQPCGILGQNACPQAMYCVTGCCRPVPR